jgi:hypothetical protein
MENAINAWYDEDDLILSPMAGAGPGKCTNKRICILRSIYRTLAYCSLKTYLLPGAIAQHHAEHLGEFYYRGDATITHGLVLCDR